MNSRSPVHRSAYLLGALSVIAHFVTACGPRVNDDSAADSSGDMGNDVAAGDACASGACPPELYCGDSMTVCGGALGIGDCIDGKCGPTPVECVVASTPERTCGDVCEREGILCVEGGCEGATAFGFTAPQDIAVQMCGSSAPSVREFVTPLDIACTDVLDFSGDPSFQLYQCCCDDPDK